MRPQVPRLGVAYELVATPASGLWALFSSLGIIVNPLHLGFVSYERYNHYVSCSWRRLGALV